MQLDEIRQEIDKVDSELIPLLLRRLNLSIKVADIKEKSGIPILDASREERILDKVRQGAEPYGNYVACVYRAIMDASKELQHDSIGGNSALAAEILAARRIIPADFDGTVACQGIAGAFSAEAASRLFPHAGKKFVVRFEDVFAAVESGEADYGILPVENSNAGSVSEVYDLLLKYRHYIVGGVEMHISQNLLGVPGAKPEHIHEVISHAQGLAQCMDFIEAHGFDYTESTNTAVAAKTVAARGDKTMAAIGSVFAAQEYGLQVLAENIQSRARNTTRFIVISKRLIVSEDSNKISLIFSVPHVTGSLYRVLTRFAAHGLNLTKIESRMAPEGNFNYLFYLDFTGNVGDMSTLKLLCNMQSELPEFTFLGNYKEIPAES